jgi:cytochrome c
MKKINQLFLIIGCMIAFAACQPKPTLKVLVFSKTEGFRHSSISAGIKAIKKLGQENNFQVDDTEDATFFEQKNLKNYQVVIFLNTTGDVLNDAQQLEFERYVKAGGNFVGVHSAADTEYGWQWYGKLVGAYFKSHPQIQEASIDIVDHKHDCTKHLPNPWKTTDEWYNYKNLNTSVNVLMSLDETSYKGGENGKNHPIAWSHEYEGGRAFYTGLGHTDEQYANPDFLKHLLGGILWASDDQKLPNYAKKDINLEENRFKKVVLDSDFNEPMELEILPDESILFIERAGIVKRFKDGKTKEIFKFNLFFGLEEGLIGMALDPNFKDNRWVYFMYSDPVDTLQNLSRFTMSADFNSIDRSSEKKILQVKTQRRQCCHSGGSIEFDAKGNLYLSSGDNTNPFDSQGFSPSDERPGRSPWDAQGTSANSMDLRGKILRITPQPDGTYTIPEGNLFANAKDGRPEIYVMGCRNPFRISIDSKTGFLYWGDVGPDASQDSTHRGAKGHDEINQARQAGFFGWPLFIGNNKPYKKFDFATRKTGIANDPKKPINNSPNNTGIKNLPPANSAFIWYPYASSEEFPAVKDGGRNAMAGEVFYIDNYPDNPRRFPAYFDGKLFIYDWIRGWIMTVTMDKNGDFQRMERFMPSHKFSNPIDMKFSPKGDLYVLEYGETWNARNKDARLVRIEYTGGNRTPVAHLEADKTLGGIPLTVNFDGQKSMDADGEDVKFTWAINGKTISGKASKLAHTFKEAGEYKVTLTVADGAKQTNSATQIITVGNEIADIQWKFKGNQTFFWKNKPIAYEVAVTDKEDGSIGKGIEASAVQVSINYLAEGKDIVQSALGHKTATPSGKALMDKSDCKACHQKDKKSSGPSYIDIANKYKEDKNAVAYLSKKIINGGSGTWGKTAMAAHPNISEADAKNIVKYILSIGKESKAVFPIAGKYNFEKHQPSDVFGKYIFKATYADKGNAGISSFLSEKTHILRQPIFMANDYEALHEASQFKIGAGTVEGVTEDLFIVNGEHDGYIHFGELDLTGITSLVLVTNTNPIYFIGGTMELRLDKPNGTVWASSKQPTSDKTKIITPLKPTPITGKHHLYLVFKSSDPASPKSVGTFIQLTMGN